MQIPLSNNRLCFLLFWFILALVHGEEIFAQQSKKRLSHLDELYGVAEKYRTNSPDSLAIVAKLILDIGYKQKNTTAIVRGERFLAQSYWALGNHSEAMKGAIKALSDAEKWKLNAEIPDIYAIIGNLHKEKANYSMALEAADKGMQIARQEKDTMSIIYMSRIKAMFTQGLAADNGDTAMIHHSLNMHLEGLKIAESSPRFEKTRIAYYNNIAQVYVKRREMDKALFFVTKGIALAKKYNQKLSLTYGYTWLSQIYNYNGQKEEGLEYLTKALSLTQELRHHFREMEIYNYLTQAYKSAGDYKNALNAYGRYSEIRDSLRVLENVRQVGEMQVGYETEKKDRKITALGQLSEVRSKQTIWALGGLGMFLLLSLFLVFQYRIIHRNNKALAQKNIMINQQAEKMQFLMKELHHRVKNNMQVVSNLLSLQASRLADDDAREIIKTGQQRIEAMSLIHRSLYNQENVNMVNMKEYVEDLVESIMRSFGMDKTQLDLSMELSVDELDVDIAMPLGLIINEWITNSFKHAFPYVDRPELFLKMEGNERLHLQIKDNGPGLDLSRWQNPKGSFGMKLVKVLARQLDGKCRVSVDSGTWFQLDIPITTPVIQV